MAEMNLQQLQAALMGLQQPDQTPADIMNMMNQSLTLQGSANRRRATPNVGVGMMRMGSSMARDSRASQDEQKALDTLMRAYQAQAGIDQYASQVQALQEQIAAIEKQNQDRENFVFEKSFEASLDTPDKVKIAQWAMQQPPEVQQRLKELGVLGGGGVTVNTGDKGLPETLTTGLANQGYMWDGEKLAPIPGGPADTERQDLNRKRTGKEAMTRRAGTTVVQDLGRAKELIPNLIPGDGMAGANARIARSKIAGSPEWTFVKNIESAKSNIGLDRLQEMRENSPTGGALGQVPFQQQKRLEQVYGEVDLGMPMEMIEANINRIQNIYTDIMYGSPEERALAVREGRMTQEDSDQVDSMYLDVPFDLMGESTDSPESEYERWKKEKGL